MMANTTASGKRRSQRVGARRTSPRRQQVVEHKVDDTSCDDVDDGAWVAIDELPEIPPTLPPIDTIDSINEPSPDITSSSSSSRNKDRSKDVLYAKGAAAQTMSNPGNLRFYSLCEARYDEFAKLVPTSCGPNPKRRIIASEIVSAILATGGVFRSIHGGVMTRSASIDKTRDRLRQIGKPKLRPTGFGPHDVVSAKGAAVHLYSGNAKWHDLLEGYVLSYFRDVVAAAAGNTTPAALLRQACTPKQRRNNKGKFLKLRKGEKTAVQQRPSYQYEIVNETIRIIHERGGKFLWEDLTELTHEEISSKTHMRFKDSKKELIAGTRTFVPHDAVVKKEGCGNPDDSKAEEENDAARGGSATTASTTISSPISGKEIIKKRLGGFTSVKVELTSKRELRIFQRKRKRETLWKTKKNYKTSSKQKTSSSRRGKGRKDSDEDEEDDCSFQSDVLDSDGSLDISDDDDSSDDDTDDEGESNTGNGKDSSSRSNKSTVLSKQANKQKQNLDREERMKRRRSGVTSPLPPVDEQNQEGKKKSSGRKKRSKKRSRRDNNDDDDEDEDTPEEEHHPLSEYELYRLEKIKRNQAKLAELGLL